MAHRLSCPKACGIFPDQGLNPRLVLAGAFFTTEPRGHEVAFSLKVLETRNSSAFRSLVTVLSMKS